MKNSTVIYAAMKWYKDNLQRLTKKSVSKIDVHYPDEDDDSFNFGFETDKNILQVILYQEGYADFYNHDIKSDKLTVKNIFIDNEKKIAKEFFKFFFYCEK